MAAGRKSAQEPFCQETCFPTKYFCAGFFFNQNTLIISVQPNALHRLGISVKNHNNLNQFAVPVSLPIQINLITKLQITKFSPRGAFSFRAFKKHCALLEVLAVFNKTFKIFFHCILLTLLSCVNRKFSCLCI